MQRRSVASSQPSVADWARVPAFRELGLGAVAGALAGILVGGIGGRVAMRLSGAMSDPALVGMAVTDNGNVLGEVTFAGTFALVLFAGLFPGLLGGVVYVAARPWLRPFGRWDGLVYGLVLLAALGSTVLEPNNIDFRKFGSQTVNALVFALLFPAFGIAQAALTRLLERRASRSPAWDGVAVVGLGLALLLLGSFVVPSVGSLVAGDRADLRPLIPAYWLLAAVALRWWLGRGRGFHDIRDLSPRDALLSALVLALPALLALPATIYAIRFLARI
jgi:hypothetical protein